MEHLSIGETANLKQLGLTHCTAISAFDEAKIVGKRLQAETISDNRVSPKKVKQKFPRVQR